MKPKTVRRLLLLGAIGAALSLGGAGFAVLRHFQIERRSRDERGQGMEAFASGNARRAVDRLEKYLRRRDDDAEALLCYARARARCEEPSGEHLTRAIAAYRHYLTLRSDDRAATFELARACADARLMYEAAAYATRLLPADLNATGPEELPLLCLLAEAMLSQPVPPPEVDATLARIADLSPLSVSWQRQRLERLHATGKDPAVRATVSELTNKYAGDPRATLISLLSPGGSEAQFPALCTLAGLDQASASRTAGVRYPDEDFALELADAFDRLGRYEHALATLIDAAKQVPTRELLTRAARRAWTAGRPDECLALLEQSPAPLVSDFSLQGLRAMSLRQTGHADEADLIVKQLRSGAADLRARSWASAAAAYPFGAGVDLVSLTRSVASAARDCPDEPVFAFVHAEVLAASGRSDEAVWEWQRSTRSLRSQGWAAPWVRLSQASRETGDLRRAVEQADMALAQSPHSIRASMERFSAQVAMVSTSHANRPEIAGLLDFADQAASALAAVSDDPMAAAWREEIAVARVLLLSRAGRLEDATSQIRALLSQQSGLGRRGLERLAMVSATEELGLEQVVLDHVESAFGQSASTTGVRAATLHIEGHRDRALAMLRSNAESASPAERLNWDLHIASFLDSCQDSGAAAAWIAVADANPTLMRVQRLALASPSACRDEAFVERASKRLSQGEDAPTEPLVLLARVRATMAGDMTRVRRDEVVATLRELVQEHPEMVDARLLLAEVLLLEDARDDVRSDLEGAIAQLQSASQASGDPMLRLRTARLLQESRRFDEARAELNTLWNESRNEPVLGREIAQMLVAQGDSEAAVPIIRELVGGSGASPTPETMMFAARVFASSGQVEAAAGLYERVAKHPATTAEKLPQVAAGLLHLGRASQAQLAVARIESVADPAERALCLARFAELTGDGARAAAAYREALAINPRLSGAWFALEDLSLRSGDLDGGEAIVRDAQRALGSDPVVSLLRQRVLIARGTWSEQELDDLAVLLGADPARASDAECVREVDQLRRTGEIDNAASLLSLAKRYPDKLPVQAFVIRRLVALSPPQTKEAARLASRAMTVFPGDAEVAHLAATVFALRGRWPQALTACEVWKERDPLAGLEADVATAEAYVGLGRPAQGATHLRSLIPSIAASEQTATTMAALAAFARASLASGTGEEAFRLMEPAMRGSKTVRNSIWLRLAGESAPDERSALRWVRAAAALASATDSEDQMALASAYSALAEKYPASAAAHADQALKILVPMAKLPQATSEVFELIGVTFARAGNLDEAIPNLRQAVALDPNRATSMVNLAGLLARKGEWKETLELVERASHLPTNVDRDIGLACCSLYNQAGVALFGTPESVDYLRRAVQAAQELARQSPGDLRCLTIYAQVASDAGDYVAVIDANSLILETAELSRATRAAAKNNLAFAMAKVSRVPSELERAESLARDCIAESPRPAFTGTLAQVLSARGRFEEATKAFRSAVAAEPSNSSLQLSLALHLSKGDAACRREAKALTATLTQQAPRLPPQDLRDLQALHEQLGAIEKADAAR